MIIDGIELVEGSKIENPTIAFGSVFPTAPNNPPNVGELFFIDSILDGYDIGLYVYDGFGWGKVITDGNINAYTSSATAISYAVDFPTEITLGRPLLDGELFYKTTTDGNGNAGLYVYEVDTWVAAAAGASALDGDLTAIAALSGTSGYLKKTAADTWALDTGTFLTTNESISISGDATGSGTTSIALTLANVVSAGTGTKISYNAKGLVTSSTSLVASDIPSLDWAKITTGKPTTLSGYGITDAQAYDADLSAIAALTGTSGFLKTNGSGAWSVDTATYLTANQSISISGDATGSGTTSIALTLANSGVTAGTYKSVTVDSKGRVTNGTNPTTLSGFGITDAQPLDADLTAIAALTGTSGFLKTNGSGTWSVDTATYLTSHPAISGAISVDNSGLSFIQDLTFDSNGHTTGVVSSTIQSASTSQQGVVQLTDSTSTTSSTLAATATAVKAAYDLAASALSNGGGTLSGNIIIPTGYHITITDAPVNGTDGVNKNYVDSNLAGLSWKNSVKAATTANITLSAEQTIDGVSVVAGNRVLVKNQNAADENGIYVVASGSWSRATDMDSTTPINEVNSAAVFVEQGSTQADSGWTQVNNVTTLGTDAISFTQFNGAAGVTPGIGLSKTGNQLDINLGAGIAQLPTDEVGIDLYSGGGLLLTTDGTNASTLTSAQLSLGKVGTAGTYKSVTTDNFGRVTAGSNPTTLSGFGITDAQPLDADLTAIAALAGTSGFLKKTAADTWSLDTNTYLTANQSITLSGDVTGSGTTAITATLATITQSTGSNFVKITLDTKGRVTGNTAVTSADITGLIAANTYQPYDADLTTWAGITPASGIGTFLATPSSANLLAAVTGETGTGSLVFATSPTLTTPNIGAATATSVDFGSAVSSSTSATIASAATPTTVATYAVATYRSFEFTIQATSGTSYHVTKAMVIHDGTTAYIDEYGTMFTGSSLITLVDASISSGNLNLILTVPNASTAIKVAAVAIKV